METTIQQDGAVEYVLDIRATADELTPEIERALRKQGATVQIKGFRPGKAPLSLLKKRFGQAVAFEIVDRKIREAYEREVIQNDDYEVLGQPTITELDYELGTDLHAAVRFGVRPQIEIKDVSGETLQRLAYEVSDDDVEEQIERLRKNQADLTPVEDEAAGEEDMLVVDMQELDADGNPIPGKREEETEFFLDDERLKDELREALVGKKAGETVRVEIAHEGEHHHEGDETIVEDGAEEAAHTHTHTYEVTIREVKRRDLPEVDDEFAKEATGGQVESIEALREDIRTRIASAWTSRGRELFDDALVRRMLDMHADVPVPDSAVSLYLDSFVEDVKTRNEGELPEGFDEAAFRAENRAEAERQARWMLIRDQFIRDEKIEVEDADMDRHFEEVAGESGGPIDANMLKSYYAQMPGMMEQVQQRVLSAKALEKLAERFTIEDLDPDAYEAALKARREEAEEAGE